MDIKELNKHQLILLTLLITFVVSVATGIVTVSLMNQAPKAVPQTINNVIQRTIEKVTTVREEVSDQTEDISKNTKDNNFSFIEGDNLIKIYKGDDMEDDDLLGEGILISDSGIILVDSNVLGEYYKYTVVLGSINFDATIIKKFNNGFSVLKISEKVKVSTEDNTEKTDENEEFQIEGVL